MSVYSYLKPKIITNSYRLDLIDRMELFFDGFDKRDALFHRGLEIWKKYENDFCGTNIFFDVFENDSELHFMQVSVFNKRLILPLFERYFHKFTSLDPLTKDTESLFHLLMHDQQFKEKFYAREDLLGICLGYGEKNAELFQKMTMLLTSMGRLDFTLETPSADRLKSLGEEFTALKRTFTLGMHTAVSRKFFFNIGLAQVRHQLNF